MQFRYKLQFDYPVLLDNASKGVLDREKLPWLSKEKQDVAFRGDTTCLVTDIVTRRFLREVEVLTGSHLYQCTIFDAEPGSKSTLHRDVIAHDRCTWAINITLAGNENLVNQYRLNYSDPTLLLPHPRGLKVYDPSPTHILVHSAPFKLHSVYLFNINEGHQAFNNSTTENWILASMRPGNKSTLTWEEVVEAFKSKIVDDLDSIPLV